MESDAILQASNVKKSIGGQRILDGIDLTIRSGERLVLMGPNGAGKSVLMSCLTGSSEPNEGSIQLLDGLTPKSARRRLSVMTQGEMAMPSHTGRENVEFYCDLHPHSTDRWAELAERLDIADDLDRPVRDYSGGMKKKLELVIALTPDVPLYFLDEPTAELDPSVVQAVHDILRDLQTEGRTVVLTSHAPIDADVADRIVFLNEGRLVANDSPEKLRSELPDVVRSTDTTLPADELLEGVVLGNGSDVRGFLPRDKTVSDIQQQVEGDVHLETPPTYVDMFDYYTKIVDA